MAHTTIRQAGLTLLRVCDGAHTEDGKGYNKLDAGFARSLLNQDQWTNKQEKALYRMLRKYRNQLSGHGIDYATLQYETTETEDDSKKDGDPMELDAHRGQFLLKSRWSFRSKAKSIGSYRHRRWIPDQRVWRYTATPEVVEGLIPYIESGEILPTEKAEKLISSVKNKIREEERKVRELQEKIGIVSQIKTGEVPEVPVPLNTQLFDHQKKAFAIGSTLDHAAFLMEQGTGKTLSAIAVVGKRFLDGQVKRLLVVAPLSVLPAWKKEFQNHADFPNRVQILNGSVNDKITTLRDWEDSEGLQVAVVNYESTWRMEEELIKWAPEMIILDESQKIKNGRAKQSKALHRIGRVANYRMILTGTPVTQSPLDTWSQYRFLDPSIFGKSFIKFRDQYARMGGYGGYQVVGYKDLDHLAMKAHSIAYRVTKEEALDLPETTDQFLYCTLDESKKTYFDMAKDLVVELESEEKITAPIILTQLLRLQQITGGFLPKADGEILQVGSEKLKVLKDFLDGQRAGKKIVVFARFVPEIEAISKIAEELGRKVVTLTGETRDRGGVVEEFQEGDADLIVIQIQTGGVGITLTAADMAIFYSTTFSYADYEQARARLHRIGQVNRVTYVHIIAEHTIDEDIQEALRTKKDVAELVVDKLKSKGVIRMSTEMEKALEDLKYRINKEIGDEEEGTEEEDQDLRARGGYHDEEAPREEVTDSKEEDTHDSDSPPDKKRGSDDEDAEVVTVKDLAYEIGISPMVLRRKLRNSDIEKPQGRWEWPVDHPDLEKIRGWKK